MGLACAILGISTPQEFKPVRPVRGIILAAGEGKRLKETSDYTGTKALFPIHGKPMIIYVLEHMVRYDSKPVIIVSEKNKDEIRKALEAAGYEAEYLVQDSSPGALWGTGAAVLQAQKALTDFDGDIIVNWSDNIVRKTETIRDTLLLHQATGASLTLPTAFLEEPETNTIRRDPATGQPVGSVQRLDVAKLAAGEVDIGLFFGRAKDVFESLGAMKDEAYSKTKGSTAAAELGFPFVMTHLALKRGLPTCAVDCADPIEAGGVNDIKQAAIVSQSITRLNQGPFTELREDFRISDGQICLLPGRDYSNYFSASDPSRPLRVFRIAKESDLRISPQLLELIKRNAGNVRRTDNPQSAIKIMDEIMALTKGKKAQQVLDAMQDAGLDIGQLVRDITVLPRAVTTDPAKRQAPIGKTYDISKIGRKAVIVLGAGDMGCKYIAAMPAMAQRFGGNLEFLGYVQPQLPNDPIPLPKRIQNVEALFGKVNPGAPLPRHYLTVSDAIARSSYAREDVVIIVATPDPTHLKAVEDLSKTGIKCFLVEKPVAPVLSELDRFMELRDEEGLEIVGQTQSKFSRVLAKIREVVQAKNFKARYLIQNWTKDRTEDSAAGRNMKKGHMYEGKFISDIPHILLFDSTHQISFEDALWPVSGLQYAFARDMEVPEKGISIPLHGEGGMILTHERELKGSVIMNCTTRAGENAPKQKAVNILGEDGSLIVAEVGTDAFHLGTVEYVSPAGEREFFTVDENSEDIIAEATAALINDLLRKNSGSSLNRLEFHRMMEVIIARAVEMTEDNLVAKAVNAGAVPASLAEFVYARQEREMAEVTI